MIPLDNLLEFVKQKTNDKEIYGKLKNSIFDSYGFKCEESSLLIDSFCRLFNDEISNISANVTSAQFFCSKKNYQKIEIINISGNYVDNNLINRSKNIIKIAKQFQSNDELHKRPNYIFRNYSTEKIKTLIFIVGYLLNNIQSLFGISKLNQDDYLVNIDTLIEQQNTIFKNLKSSIINTHLAADFLDLSIEFLYNIFYKNAIQFQVTFKEEKNSKLFVSNFLIFLQSVWDAYSFNVLSR